MDDARLAQLIEPFVQLDHALQARKAVPHIDRQVASWLVVTMFGIIAVIASEQAGSLPLTLVAAPVVIAALVGTIHSYAVEPKRFLSGRGILTLRERLRP